MQGEKPAQPEGKERTPRWVEWMRHQARFNDDDVDDDDDDTDEYLHA